MNKEINEDKAMQINETFIFRQGPHCLILLILMIYNTGFQPSVCFLLNYLKPDYLFIVGII